MKKIFPIILLFLIFTLALFFRIYFCYDKVFSDPIKYAADDGVYHMRLVENELLGEHFPRRIYFDAYTYFPYGTYIYFTPLYDQLLAGTIWLVSLGQPSLELINKIAPFYPAVLGSLMVFLVYFIAKAIWGRKVGFFSALLMAFSSPFLYRSLLGSTDHHVAEVLFSTLTMMFLIFALKAHPVEEFRKDFSLEKSNLRSNPKFLYGARNKRFWLFTFLTGFSLGLYFLTWSGALLFLFIIFVFINLYYLIEYLSGRHPPTTRTPNWILSMGVIIFLITLAMIAPFFGHPDLFNANMYNIQHLLALVLGIFGFIFVGLTGNFIKKKGINRWLFPFFLILAAILFLVILKFIFPSFFEAIIKSFQGVTTGVVPHELAREFINEMGPLGFQGAINAFSSLFYLSLIALVIIFYKFIKKKKPEYLLILIWTLVIILMTGIIPFFGQKRFIYYLAANISLLSGFLIVRGFGFGWRGLKISQRIPLKPSIKPYFLVGTLLIVFNVIFFSLFPFPFNIGEPYPKTLPHIVQTALSVAKLGPFIRENDWYETLKWLRENTSDPGIDYYALYQEPGVNKETEEINPYPYPEEAYGILARWDLGHMITYYAHRIPNSNPFQQGVGRKNKEKILELGEGVFFLETSEEKAVNYLEKLRTKYIITDYQLAHPDRGFRSKVKWVQGNLEGYLESEEPVSGLSKYDNSMIARLHVLDGRGKTIEIETNGQKKEFYIEPLSHFRLVYESKRTVVSSGGDSEDIIKAIKIFEYVKGARIRGKAKSGTEVIISTEIETNQDRKFVYQKNTEAENGHFEFIVPYSTFGEEGRLSDQTQFVVFAQPYKIKIKDKEIEVNISEKDVLEGRTIEI